MINLKIVPRTTIHARAVLLQPLPPTPRYPFALIFSLFSGSAYDMNVLYYSHSLNANEIWLTGLESDQLARRRRINSPLGQPLPIP